MTREDAIAAETVRVVARRGPTTISQTRHGFVMAAAGVDESNTAPGTVVLLPEDPDESARRLRKALRARPGVNVGVVITDTFGRPWRAGQTDTAIGAAGVLPVRDHRGEADAWGNTLDVTMAAVADEIAAARQPGQGQGPAGARRPRARAVRPGHRRRRARRAGLVRPSAEDMFRLGAADVLPARRTVRAFTAQPVDPAAVERAIAAALTAPAPHHSEPWRFVIVSSLTARLALLDAMQDAWVADLRRDGFTEEQIARRLRRGEPLRHAPLIVVPCLELSAMHAYPDDRRTRAERDMFVVSMGAAVQNLLVALAVENLGSAWISSPCSARTSPPAPSTCRDGWLPMGAVAIGHPAARPAAAAARPGRLHGDPLALLANARQPSARLHAVAGHQGALLLRGGRFCPGPQRLELGEVGVHRRGVQHEQPRGLVAVVAEGVRRAARHQQEVVATAVAAHAVEDERDRPVEHPEGLRAVHVPVRQRAAAARRNGPLHQGKIPVRLRGDGLKGHHAPPRGDDPALPRGNNA